jgi:hypothetical protein
MTRIRAEAPQKKYVYYMDAPDTKIYQVDKIKPETRMVWTYLNHFKSEIDLDYL